MARPLPFPHTDVVKRVIAPAVLAALALAAWSAVFHPWAWLYALGVHPYPASSSTPWTYQMWSGIVPALTVLTLFGSLGGAYHLHNCHQRLCWRLGKHKIGGTPWCSRHQVFGQPEFTDSDRLDTLAALLQRLVDKA